MIKLASRTATLFTGIAITLFLALSGTWFILSFGAQDGERLSYELYRLSADIVGAIGSGSSPDMPPELKAYLFIGGKGERLGAFGSPAFGSPPANPSILKPNGYWMEGKLAVYHRQASGGGGGTVGSGSGSGSSGGGGGRQIVLWYDPSHLFAEYRRRDFGLFGALGFLCGLVVFSTALSLRLMRTEERMNTQERLALLGQASRTISHEIQNPLTALELHRQLAEKKARLLGTDGEALAEHLRVMAAETDRIRGIIRNVRKLIHPEQGAMEDIELHRFARENAARFPLPPGQSVEVLPAAEAWVRADPAQLSSILGNLLSNAAQSQVQKNCAEPIRLRLGGSRGSVFLEVIDRGAGLDATAREHAFDPLFTTKPEGSGLGLSLARALARSSGGDLRLRSTQGAGCVARLTLPRAKENRQ